MFAPLDPIDPTLPNPALANWQEHQRRQRTLRMLMMFLMILLLMDGDEPVERRNRSKQHLRAGLDRERTKYGNFGIFVDDNGDLLNPLNWAVWKSRREEDGALYDAVAAGSRYGALVTKNSNDIDKVFRKWAERKVVTETKVALGISETPERMSAKEKEDRAKTLLMDKWLSVTSVGPPEYTDDAEVFHYPTNATGYYRGSWVRVPNNRSTDDEMDGVDAGKFATNSGHMKDITLWMQQQLEQKKQDVGIFILPSNATTNNTGPKQGVAPIINDTSRKESTVSTLTLTKEAGRAAFQLYSRPIPAMTELSIVDGLVKLYDGMTTTFVSRRTDVLLRVRGVIIHGSGKMSLVSSSIAGGSIDGKIRSYLGIKQVEKTPNDDDDEIEQSQESEQLNFVQVEEEYVDEITDRQRHRRLQDLLNAFLSQHDSTEGSRESTTSRGLFYDAGNALSQIRDDIMDLYASQYAHEIMPMEDMKQDGWSVLQSIDTDSLDLGSELLESRRNQARALQSLDSNTTDVPDAQTNQSDESGKQSIESQLNTNSTHDDGPVSRVAVDSVEQTGQSEMSNLLDEESKKVDITNNDETDTHRSAPSTEEQPKQSQSSNHKITEQLKEPQYVYPFPYVCDDSNESMKKTSSPTSRRLPARELILEANAAHCEFEMNIDILEQPWTFAEWRNTVLRRFRSVQAFNPYLHKFDKETERLKRSQILNINSQVGFTEDSVTDALVMTMSGTVQSVNCNFNSFVNVTAIRTNWEHTTAKAINYSFYMMLTCLCQIVVLLRQLLHTQAQSAASNVSLFCIGWQTVLDAILCIAHIFLCLVMQPLFTAFASVAFFKLLIFCVIEMKYMALIIQARNNANNPNHTQDDLRRQITLLHLRFYAALMVAIMSFWYIGQTYRTLYVLLLYSFWVPQIILNAITEARKPMHSYYIYGMSATRLVAPIYVFAVHNNFLKEVNPDFPSDPQMCQLLVLWVMIQTAILVGQGKYGTRFMIPQR